jgi:hypothetical protein
VWLRLLRNHARPAHLAGVRSLSATRGSHHKLVLKIAASLHKLPAGAQLAYAWIVRRAGRVIATHAVLAPSSQHSASFAFAPRGKGTYVLTGSVTVITRAGLGAASASSVRRLAFHAG